MQKSLLKVRILIVEDNRYPGGGYNPYENNPNHDTGRRLDGSPSSP